MQKSITSIPGDRDSRWRARLSPSRYAARFTVPGGSPGGSPSNSVRPRSLHLHLYLCLCLLPACAQHPRVVLPEPPRSEEIDTLLARSPLAPGENIKAVPLQRGEHSSVTLVQIRDREPPHRHTRYDITVLLVRGKGTLHLGDRTLPMQTGDASFITKGTPHYFVNDGAEPAAALVTSAPAFSGPDQEPVE